MTYPCSPRPAAPRPHPGHRCCSRLPGGPGRGAGEQHRRLLPGNQLSVHGQQHPVQLHGKLHLILGLDSFWDLVSAHMRGLQQNLLPPLASGRGCCCGVAAARHLTSRWLPAMLSFQPRMQACGLGIDGSAFQRNASPKGARPSFLSLLLSLSSFAGLHAVYPDTMRVLSLPHMHVQGQR